MTGEKVRELTEDEVYWLYVEGIAINSSYPAKAIPVSKLIELLDRKKAYDQLMQDAEELAEALEFYGNGFCDHERDYDEIVSGKLRPNFKHPVTYGENARKALSKWREKYGDRK